MNLRSGYPFSLIKNGLLYNYPKLEQSIETDVIIIGGGISGALMAYYLIEAGISCVLVDGRTIGLGSTAASTSLLQYEIDIPLTKLIDLRGYDSAARSFILCKEAIDKLATIAKHIGCKDFHNRNSLYFATSSRHAKFLQEEYARRKEVGFQVEYLSKEEIRSQFNFTSEAAILSRHGAQMDAYAFTHLLLQHCIKKGLRVYDRTLITKIESNSEGVLLKTANKNSLKGRKLVNSTGYEVINFIGKKYVKLHSTYAIISEHTSPDKIRGINDTLFWNTADPYLYITSIDGRIMVGGRDENFYSPSKRDKLIQRKSKQLQKDFQKIFSHVSFNTEFSWTGTFGATKDGLPFIGTLGKEQNIYYALGFGGNGITFSQIGAEIITDLIQGKQNMDATIFAFDR